MKWDDCIMAEMSGMAGGESYYSFEDIYQAIKERLMKEVQETNKPVKRGPAQPCGTCGHDMSCDSSPNCRKCGEYPPTR